jgi:NAD(P) transhydrogenase subunit alpha
MILSPDLAVDYGRSLNDMAMALAQIGQSLIFDDTNLFPLSQADGAAGAAAHAVTGGAVDPFVFRFSIFVLAVFVGYFVVWSVTPALHTPLMSVTNAISSVIVVGALLAVGVELVRNDNGPVWARALGFIALVFASVNIFGGFLVTRRMLSMYQKKKK